MGIGEGMNRIAKIQRKQSSLFKPDMTSPSDLVRNILPYYITEYGAAYLADSLQVMKELPPDSVNLVLTSPPYALHFKKEYGNVEKSDYVPWFLDFAKEIIRVLKDDGSFILNIGGSYNKGAPNSISVSFQAPDCLG